MPLFSRLSRITTALIAVFLLGSCETSSTGRRQLILMSDSALEAQAAALYGEMQQKMVISTDEAKRNYVLCVSNAITRALPSKAPDRWEVTLFEEESANAFALPGAKIGVYTGLLDVAENADQLAAVISHEVAHVLERHSNERVSSNVLSGTVVAIGTEVLADGEARRATHQALSQGAQLLGLLPYSRAHEAEADQIGIVLMAKAGFDPAASVQLWKNMAAANTTQPPEILSTHPAPATRIQKLSSYLRIATPVYQQAQANGHRPACRKP
ncbi:MAG: M48 family metallopeptidase [Myxococcota bacterium]|nr:M48 family metallopeptidase [Myxococcota bacterium]